MLEEIVLPETKPETEWVAGRALQKVSPTYAHARLQMLFGFALMAWAEGRGRVGSEWRFRIAPPGEVVRPLVPDVAYLSFDRVGRGELAAAQVPLSPPNAAVEILSPDDRERDVRDKIATYLRAGTDVVIIVDPSAETLVAHSPSGVQTTARGGLFRHPALPGLSLDTEAYFAGVE